MRILIATGIYPPQIGGPAQYAKGTEQAFVAQGHIVTIKTYCEFEGLLPVGIRHIYFATKSLWAYLRADRIIVLDTFSVALPVALLTFVFRKKFIIRTGGDFLWEAYVERTGKKVLLKDFYVSEIFDTNQNIKKECLTNKEYFIFRITKWVLGMSNLIVFSTRWQKDIWNKSYNIDILEKEKSIKVKIIENYVGERIAPQIPRGKYFVASTRALVWKNIDMLREVFECREIIDSGARFDNDNVEHNKFLEKIASSYAVILVSLGDISPNMIFDAIRCGKPFICTIECGLYEKLKDIGIWVDPLNKEDIKEKILWLLKENNYQDQCIKVASFRETHSWKQISEELIMK